MVMTNQSRCHFWKFMMKKMIPTNSGLSNIQHRNSSIQHIYNSSSSVNYYQKLINYSLLILLDYKCLYSMYRL